MLDSLRLKGFPITVDIARSIQSYLSQSLFVAVKLVINNPVACYRVVYYTPFSLSPDRPLFCPPGSDIHKVKGRDIGTCCCISTISNHVSF